MNFIISNNSDVPIYQQIKNEIINSISNNDLKENDMLPSIRNLAKDLRISILTVKKAYDELEQEAYIKTVQGKGTFITPRNKALIREKQISIIEKHIEQMVDIAKISNISKEEVMENILEVKKLSKKYDGFEFKNINIELPKGTVITNIPEEFIQQIENWINNLLRPMFGYKSSLEMAKNVS